MTRRVVLAAAAGVAAVAVAVPAWAYFASTSSTVTPNVSAASVSAPGTVSVTSINGTATLTWSAPSAPSGATFTYTVSRSGGSGTMAGSCAATSISGATCQDTAATPGQEYTWTVTPHVGNNWNGSTASVTARAAGALSKFAVTGAPGSVTAGDAFTVTVTAQDSLDDTVTGYTGTVQFSSTDSQAVLPSDTTFTSGNAGVHTLTNGVTLKTAGSRTVSVKDSVATSAAGTSAGITVTPATPSKLAFTTQPGGATVGTAFTTQPVVAIQDAYGNATNSSATVTLAIKANTGATGAALSCTDGLSKAATAGTATFVGCAIDKPGTAYQLTATATSLTGTDSTAFNVNYLLAFTAPANNATGVSRKVTISGTGANPVGGSVTLTFSPALLDGTTTSVTVSPDSNGNWSYNQGTANYLSNNTAYSITASQTGATSANVSFHT